jgi:triacylglycerol lipase
VILVHGTFGDMTVSWNTIAPALEARGYCVWALDYGNRGTGDIDRSADQLVAFIAKVQSVTGAAKVSMIGHSQGGMLARYVTVRRGLLGVVDDVVGLAPSSHGTTNPLAGPAGVFGCTACAQQKAGSAFMRKVNQPPPEAPGPAWYTTATTTHDEVVTPYRSQLLAGRPRHQRDPAGQVPARPVRARHDRRRPGCAAVGDQRARPPRRRQPGFKPDCTGLSTAFASASLLKIALGKRTAKGIRVRCRGQQGAVCIGRLQSGRRTKTFRIRTAHSRVVRLRLSKTRASVPCSRCPGGGAQVLTRRYRLR